MSVLNFTRFSGAVSRCKGYATAEQDGVLFFFPKQDAASRRYDPFADVDGLLLDVAGAGAAVAACDPFLSFCIDKGMLPLRDAEVWLYGDFFTARPREARPLTDTLLAFVERYGLPAWDARSVVTTYYPARYEAQMMALRQTEREDAAYLAAYETAKAACQRTGAVPVCTVALTLLGFYLQWIEGLDGGAFPIRGAEWMMDSGHEKTPRLTAQVYDLTSCINLAYALSASGEGRAVRRCKHCGSFFIANDWRAEYCSPQCRGAYNSKMTRRRVKERKLREDGKLK